MISLCLLLAAVAVSYLIWHKFSYWERKGVKYVKNFSLFGTISQNVWQKESMAYILQRCYNQFSTEPYFGIFTFLKPTLVLRDPELIKQIGIKDYDTFLVHKLFSTNDPNQPFSKNLFASTGSMWKRVRPSLSPAFSSGKIRAMFNLVDQCAKQCIKSLSEHNEDVIKINLKDDVMFRFTNDAIANCIFGLESNSFKDKHNEFFERNEKMSDFGGNRIFSLFGYCFNTFIVNLFKLSVVPKEHAEFFSDVVRKTIKLRKDMNIVRPDMINLLLQAQKGKLTDDANSGSEKKDFAAVEEANFKTDLKKEEITDLDIIGHSLLFLIAGSDTTACGLNFLFYELVVNPEIQKKLYKEISSNSDGDYNYEKIQQLKYLDMVVSETLRKWPPLPVTDRCTVRPYTLNVPGQSPVYLETGSVVWIPTFCIHRDPNNFPDPDKFIPERFSEENKSNFNKDLYIPFGMGPRACIGSRLGLLMFKSIVLNILLQYEVVAVEETPSNIKLSRKHIFLNPNETLLLGLKRRRN